MNLNNFNNYFSEARTNRYLIASKHAKIKALDLYKANLKISQSFHPLLGILEVILRNKLNSVLENFFSDPNWIINQKNGFMSDPSLIEFKGQENKTAQKYFLKSEIIQSELKISKSGKLINSNRLISEQNFGFWTAFFETKHYRLLLGKPIQIFKTLPPKHGRKEIYEQLTNIRKFRNRINHNEPICFSENKVDFSEALAVNQSILDIFIWIDPEILTFISDFNSVEKNILSSTTTLKC